MNRISVAYRIYPGISKVPPLYSDDKLELVLFCFNSFCKALSGMDVTLTVLLDNCPEEYQYMLNKVWSYYFKKKEEITFIKIVDHGNFSTFKKQIEILSASSDKILMFAEDDYFYFANSIRLAYDIVNCNKANIVSLYDHPDYYKNIIHSDDTSLLWYNHYFRKSRTTCLTFLINKQALQKYKYVFNKYSMKFMDYSLWLSITSGLMYMLNRFFSVKNKKFILSATREIIFSSSYRPFRKKQTIYTPIPTLSLHMESDYLSYGFDWKLVLEKAQLLWKKEKNAIFKN